VRLIHPSEYLKIVLANILPVRWSGGERASLPPEKRGFSDSASLAQSLPESHSMAGACRHYLKLASFSRQSI
jgi:hypothetical protein